MEIGSNGLQEVNLTIPQGTSLTFTVIHKDDEGDVVDHSQSTAKMAFQTKDKATTTDLSACCECGESGITVTIPASVTSDVPVGKQLWDIIVIAGEEQTRLCYGQVSIVDTYALDEVV